MGSTELSGGNGGNAVQEHAGRWRWIAVLALWYRYFTWVGFVKGLAIMLPTLQEQLYTQTFVIGWITAGVNGIGGLVSPFAVPLSKRFDSGYVVIVCGAITGLAVMAASFVVTPLQLMVLYTVLAGFGLGVINIICKEFLARLCIKNYATASGFARTGASIGLFVYAPLTQLFLNTYGWRGTMLLTGAISLHLVVCGCLMVTARLPRPNSHDYEGICQDDQSQPTHRRQHATFLLCCGTFWKQTFKNFDLELLVNARYWAVALVYCCSSYAFIMWVVYFVSLAQSSGFSLEDASTMVTVAGAANLIAKVLQGFITDRGLMSTWSLLFICTSFNSVAYCASSWLTSYWALMTSAVLILFSDGIISCQYDVLTRDTLGVDLVAGAFGWISLKGSLILLFVGFVPGLLYDVTGSYVGGFLLIGGAQAVPVVALLVLKRLGNPAQ